MSRRRDYDGPLPTVGSNAGLRSMVHAYCTRCDRFECLDLPALAAAGHANTALIHLRLKCRACGSTDIGIQVAGNPEPMVLPRAP